MLLALFPLQLALFPGEQVPLHIFEPRYKQLIGECVQQDIRFGIPAYFNGNISRIGTEVRLLKVVKTYDNGELDIVIEGVRVFKIAEFRKDVPDKLYSGAIVEYQENDSATDKATVSALREKFAELMRLMKRSSSALDVGDDRLGYGLGAEAGLSLQQRIHMLSLSAEVDRQKFLLAHIDRVTRLIRERDSGAGRVSTNGRARTNGAAHS